MNEYQTVRGVLPSECARLSEHDPTSAYHSIKVARFALGVGIEQSFTTADLKTLYLGALLHDVGKLDVPRALLTKEGSLTAFERTVVDTHAHAGEQMLRGYGAEIAAIARDHHTVHHEMSADPLTRIVAVCDEWEALRARRPYKAAMSTEEAREVLEKGYAGDPARLEILAILSGTHDRPGIDEMTRAQQQILESTRFSS